MRYPVLIGLVLIVLPMASSTSLAAQQIRVGDYRVQISKDSFTDEVISQAFTLDTTGKAATFGIQCEGDYSLPILRLEDYVGVPRDELRVMLRFDGGEPVSSAWYVLPGNRLGARPDHQGPIIQRSLGGRRLRVRIRRRFATAIDLEFSLMGITEASRQAGCEI